ncbi:hypothetical protein O9K51_08411 [Purpureocillium lavendulum]|uniref:ATP-dependent DNA helicase n=1 Tax=Purpureocillium lavendulum TaxID=1247861 RepID=A0AB34FJ77_9HYPO|nr:hypothetical protein O9K51_08411 [Purpureocillium lavendulum]
MVSQSFLDYIATVGYDVDFLRGDALDLLAVNPIIKRRGAELFDPFYRRRDTGERVEKRVGGNTVWLDNRWVIPYNPYLSRKYNAHINVEVSSNIHAVKYVHKYIYKGSDRATANIAANAGGPVDEIDVYLQCRYISPAEAVVRIFEFPTHEEYPPVIALPVHLEREQAVYFPEDADAQELEAVLQRNTPLMAFFRYNELHEDGRQTLYADFPTKYVFNPNSRHWMPRQQRAAIGRLLYVPPQAGERWYLRLLLSTFPGATSFTDLRTIDGTLHATFREACVAAGLLEDDRHWIVCFEEASLWQTGRRLRDLFILCLLHGDVSQPAAMWEQFRNDLCDDLPRRMPADHDAPAELSEPWIDYGLYLITAAIEDSGRHASDFGLPTYQHAWQQSDENRLIRRELAYDRRDQRQSAEQVVSAFNHDQKAIFDEVLTTVECHPNEVHFFIQGPGGSGKTFLYRGLCAHYRSHGHICTGHDQPENRAPGRGESNSHCSYKETREDLELELSRLKESKEQNDALLDALSCTDNSDSYKLVAEGLLDETKTRQDIFFLLMAKDSSSKTHRKTDRGQARRTSKTKSDTELSVKRP